MVSQGIEPSGKHRHLGVNAWPQVSSAISPRKNLKLGLRSVSASPLNVRGETNRALVGEGVSHLGHPQAEKA